VDTLIHVGGQAQPNGPGKALCAALTPMLNKFPFSPNATAEVSPAELSGVLQPGSGLLWQNLNGPWKTVIVQTGAYYSAAPGSHNVNPDFVHFFNKMAALSAVLYPPSGTPGLALKVSLLHSPGIQKLAFAMDGQQFAGLDVSNGFKWSLSSAQMVQLTTNSDTLPFAGPWDIFHFVDHGKVEQSAPVLRLAYPVQQAGIQLMDHGVPIVARVELSGPNVDLLAPGGITGLRCVATVVH
jgi:type VI secretion system protein ImpL